MKREKNIMITHCPVGCDGCLCNTMIELREGALRICNNCGQLLSQCSVGRYHETMREFDQEGVTLPEGKSVVRAFRIHSKRLELIKRFTHQKLENIKLLDVGCSSGAFLKNAKELGYDVTGVEPAKKAVNTARLNGLNVYCGMLEDIGFKDAQFDAITLFEVIEHLKNPKSLLLESYRLLKENGIMMIGTGNTRSWTVKFMKSSWEYFDIDKHGGHISFFNPCSIGKLAQSCDFKVELIKTRRVKLCEKNDNNKLRYKFLKLLAELLNMPSQVFGKGHDMLVVLRKNKSSIA